MKNFMWGYRFMPHSNIIGKIFRRKETVFSSAKEIEISFELIMKEQRE